ncbi:PPC domain-containing DNA-binding protein [Pseudodesulfovibrio senegalensis]|uniref:DNA-binding protein n=1 Tax=Pseudodesulfovibrio senegalensis TaxID=1721087 RepID=A0A6N6MZ85_9BACT|nr:PPC domain-containing DNA-binding protein [Pseudodesulfovibrio senegalensis]KAB1440380.1 DNA-binding protein [Pseudodesulfovibrio senegalensis]
MQYSEGRMGRIFTLRLEDGDRLPECVEDFASQQNIESAFCLLLGGIGSGSIVVGPEDPHGKTITPVLQKITGAHEAAAVGTLFRDEKGAPVLHMHATMGRGQKCRTGCIRPGVDTWLVGEFVIVEILDSGMMRATDPTSGFKLLTRRRS